VPQLKAGSRINRSTHGKKRSLACESAIPTHACLGGRWPRPVSSWLVDPPASETRRHFLPYRLRGLRVPGDSVFLSLSFGRFVVVKAAASIGCGLVTTSVDGGMEWRGLFPVPELSPRTSGLGHPLSAVMGNSGIDYELAATNPRVCRRRVLVCVASRRDRVGLIDAYCSRSRQQQCSLLRSVNSISSSTMLKRSLDHQILFFQGTFGPITLVGLDGKPKPP
jgi:hypothetical protein